MRVAVDLTALLPRPAGVDTYLMGLVSALAELDHDNEYLLFVNAEDRVQLSVPANFRVLALSRRPRLTRLVFQQIVQPPLLRWFRVDVLHSPTFIMPIWRAGRRHLLTIHDMSSFILPHLHPPSRRGRMYEWALARSIRRADLVSVPSASVKQDILALVPDVSAEKVRVIRSGVSARFAPRSPREIAPVVERLGLRDPYLLYVGTIDPRKNLVSLLESYRAIVTSGDIPEHLVLAGQLGWNVEALRDQLRRPELRDRVHLLGYVSPEDLPALYAGARLFVYPSLLEGFGFPPLEAMASGVPVVASSSSSLADNLTGAAELVEATDVGGLRAAIERLLHDEPRRAELIARGMKRAAEFRWDRFGRETLDCYRELAARPG